MRAQGFYWVKYKGDWSIAEFLYDYSDKEDGVNNDQWLIINDTRLKYDSDFEEIDERRIVRPITKAQ